MSITFSNVNSTPIAEGGEGYIYEYGDKIIKIFKDTVNISVKERKIKHLMNLNLHPNVIAPLDVVYDNKGTFIGYLMQRVFADEFKRLANKKFVVANNISTKDILEMLLKVKQILETLHKNNIFVGDLNDQNILFNNKKEVFFIDCDSWSIGLDKCNVAMDLFKDPRLVGDNFNADTDNYSFAILAWKSLTRIHPFGGTMKPDIKITERMLKGISVIGREDITIPKTVKYWNWVSPNLLEEFKTIFNGSKRVNLDCLKELYQNLSKCEKDGEYYFNKFTSCPFCNANAEIHIKPMSCGTMSGLNCFAVYNPKNIKIMLWDRTYLDNDGNIHIGEHTVAYKIGIFYYFTENGFLIEDYKAYFIIHGKQDFKIVKRYNSSIKVCDNCIYFISKQNSFQKIEVRNEGNFITQISKCSARSDFEVSSNDYCLINYYDSQLIVNINGINTIIKYHKKTINYGLHFDKVTKKWLLIFENEDGKFNTIIINKNKIEYETDEIKYQCQLSSVCISNSIIFIPIDKKIRGYSYSKQIFKDFECDIVSEDSNLTKDGRRFIIVNPENMYMLE